MSPTFATRFAAEWIDAWNARDLTRVLALYADDFEMSSPFIVSVAGEPSGRLRGKPAVEAYWRRALEGIAHLHFELRAVLGGVDSVALVYQGHEGRLVAEVLHFAADGKVARAFAHYAP